MSNENKKTNRLINEKSPYLLQHAYNPVDWYPWKEEAFEKAQRENKPIFLSIGYSTCHWCHVMEGESFEDEEVAKILNDNFISIKVDREERPDIDNIYMTVCQVMTGSGGWPLTIIMTPDKNPFYAATYIPKEGRYGRPGMVELLPRIKDIWDNDYNSIDKSVKGIVSHIKNMEKGVKGKGITKETFEKAYNQFKNRFDSDKGGFGKAPKFPTPHNLMFLLRYHKVKGEKHSLHMVEKTLDEMAKGGIFDHIGYGFHRYSTDANWILPHFEKMLYDEALICMVYTEAYQLTRKELYKDTAEKILKYVLRDMTSSEGGFYSAEDADSEGEEGKFYLWGYDELQELLSSDEFEMVKKVFNVKKDGNFTDEATGRKNGLNILYIREEIKDEYIKESIKNIREKLFENREKRQRPLRDEKILTDWNGLMIAAMSKAYCVFSNEEYLEAAKKAERFIGDSIEKNKRIIHRYFKGEWDINGNIDDYAFYVYGLIELYEATFDVSYIHKATTITNEMIEHFRDKENGGFYFTPNDGEELIIRNKEIYDGAVPSGNSVAAYNLIRLSKIAGINIYGVIANEINIAFSNEIEEMPSAYTMMLIGMDFVINNSFEVVIVGDTLKDDTREMISLLRNNFLPNVVITLNPSITESNIHEVSNYPQSHLAIDNKATAYVCSEGMCMQPTNDIDKLKNNLKI